jgi:hypothetical protein
MLARAAARSAVAKAQSLTVGKYRPVQRSSFGLLMRRTQTTMLLDSMTMDRLTMYTIEADNLEKRVDRDDAVGLRWAP